MGEITENTQHLFVRRVVYLFINAMGSENFIIGTLCMDIWTGK